MATPSSSATSESPPMAYLQAANVAPAPSSSSSSMDVAEHQDNKSAIQKFLARAEVGMVTRGLRTRLQYASLKVSHNVPHMGIRELEVQPSSSSIFARQGTSKRKMGGNNYYNNPATQGTKAEASAAARKGSMAPPTVSASAARTHYPTQVNRTNPHAPQNASQSPSLYTSLLAPPPAKVARTIHNVNDPFVAAPTRPNASPRLAPTAKPGGYSPVPGRSLVEGTRSHAKGRADDKPKPKRAPKGKQKGRMTPQGSVASKEDDIKAAQTLTSLLMQNSRSSVTATTTSPRSSISTSSDVGSSQSHSQQFAQSSARMMAGRPSPGPAAQPPLALPPPTRSTATPPPLSDDAASQGGATPTASRTGSLAPTDNEAADLMLFLATSPSPARATTTREKDAKDAAAFRALGGGGRPRGRVLFPTTDSGGGGSGGGGGGKPLSRVGEGSFGSSLGSISDISTSHAAVGSPSRLAGTPTLPETTPPRATLAPPVEPSRVTPTPPGRPHTPTQTSGPTPSQLLPPPPVSPATQRNAERLKEALTQWSEAPAPAAAPGSPGGQGFNFSDFLHASPAASPARGSSANTSLRADVGRRLFEQEQQQRQQAGPMDVERPGSGLGAGIDLVHSQS